MSKYKKGKDARNYKHGACLGKLSSEYYTWSGMKSRCSNSQDVSYKNYGGRGITVCQRWIDSFENFYVDMGEKPCSTDSIDRIDNDKGYSKENCRWTDRSTQAHNRRIKSTNISGYTGVNRHQNCWVAQIQHRGHKKHLGSFDCKHKAAMTYDMYKEKMGILPYKKGEKSE